MAQRDERGEAGIPGGVIVGAVDRVDHPHRAIAGEGLQHPSVGADRFLTDHEGSRQQAAQGYAQRVLGRPVRDGDQIARRLLDDVVGGQPAEPGHDLFVGDDTDESRYLVGVPGTQHRPSLPDPRTVGRPLREESRPDPLRARLSSWLSASRR